MNILIIKNATNEGPGTIEEHLLSARRSYSVVDLGRGHGLPELNKFSHVVILGGPMAVYEMDQVPYLRQEAQLIENAVKANKPVLGVCLGAQMIAHVLGARVYPGGAKEIGWSDVTITEAGKTDGLMAGLAVDGPDKAAVFQWHGDTFDIPAGAVHLASSELFPNQAFRYSDRVYALQFHIEVTPVIVMDWLKHEKSIDLAKVRADSDRLYNSYRARALQFYKGFFA